MPYPLIGRQLLPFLRLAHGAYNTAVIVLFFYHGRLGLAVRRARLAGGPLPFHSIRRHRKGGPVFAGLGILGFFFGFTLVMLDTGKALEYPAHFFVGFAIVLGLAVTFALSRKIKGPQSVYRTPHFILGVAILCLYLAEAVIGLGVLF